MNAALEAGGADRKIGTSSDRSFFNAAWRNKNKSSKVEALGRRYRITRNAVEFSDEAAAKGSDRCKGVYLAADVLN